MTLPGVEQLMEDARNPSGPRLRLSTPYIIAETERGPETAQPLVSMRDLRRVFGARTTVSAAVHDWLEEYWRQGGGLVYLARRLGPAAAPASHIFVDGTSATALTVRMREKGAFGNEFSADIDVTGTDYTVKLLRNGVELENSGLLADGAAATAWAAANSSWVDIIDGAGVDPVATTSAAALTSGADDLANVTDTETQAAIDKFSAALGTGVYVLVGITASGPQLLAGAAAAQHNRLARVDLPDTATVATLKSQAATLKAGLHGDVFDVIAPPLTAPGLSPSTTRTVPGSVLRCACEAVNDRAGISPNQPAAGRWGAPKRPGLTPVREWTDAEREELNDAGINVIRVIDGETRIYGSRTLADPEDESVALRLGSARLRMAIAEIGRFEAEQTAFAEIDAGGVVLGELEGRIEAGISQYLKSLYLLEITAELVEDEDQEGQYLVEIVIEFQAAPDAERVRVIVTRSNTEV